MRAAPRTSALRAAPRTSELQAALRTSELRTALRTSDLLRAMSDAQLDAVLARATARTAEAGDTVIRRGDAGPGLILVLHGRLRVGVVSVDGREITLRVLGAGEVIGEMSLLDGEPASADVQALESVSLLLVPSAAMLALMRQDFELCLAMMAVLCQRLRHANETAEDLALHGLPARIGRVLGRLARDFGSATADGILLGVALPQRELAQLVGASREKVNRELRALEARGILARRQGRLVILRPDLLATAGRRRGTAGREPRARPGQSAARVTPVTSAAATPLYPSSRRRRPPHQEAEMNDPTTPPRRAARCRMPAFSPTG